jgi:hypothetical protein
VRTSLGSRGDSRRSHRPGSLRLTSASCGRRAYPASARTRLHHVDKVREELDIPANEISPLIPHNCIQEVVAPTTAILLEVKVERVAIWFALEGMEGVSNEGVVRPQFSGGKADLPVASDVVAYSNHRCVVAHVFRQFRVSRWCLS